MTFVPADNPRSIPVEFIPAIATLFGSGTPGDIETANIVEHPLQRSAILKSIPLDAEIETSAEDVDRTKAAQRTGNEPEV